MTQTAQTSLDALATRAKIAVIVPATNTVVQPEMEAMRRSYGWTLRPRSHW